MRTRCGLSTGVGIPGSSDAWEGHNLYIMDIDIGSGLVNVVENCPRCKLAICPATFRVNVITFNVSTKCVECGLEILFLLKDSRNELPQ